MTTTPTEPDLDALDALCSSASPLPWFAAYRCVHSAPVSREYDRLEALIPDDAADDDQRWDALPDPVVCSVPRLAGDLPTAQGAKDAAFIVAACNAAPILAADVRRLRLALTEALDEFDDALGYVEKWAMNKWGYREKVARLRDVVKGAASAEPAQNVKGEP